MENLIESLMNQEKDIIIGLTGRTGSGCSMIAETLKKATINNLNLTVESNGDEGIKETLVIDYIKSIDWHPFQTIQISNIILYYILEEGLGALNSYLEELANKDLSIATIRELERDLRTNIASFFETIKELDDMSDKDKLKFYSETLTGYKATLISIFKRYSCNKIVQSAFKEKKIQDVDLFSYLFQQVGNNLRSSGKCYVEGKGVYKNKIIQKINEWINLIKKTESVCRICIDSFRNPLEIMYFKSNYLNFYTFAIKASDTKRRERLESKFNTNQLANLDEIEYPKKAVNFDKYYKQNVQKCIEIADIHIDNNKTKQKLYLQIVKYIALIIHPGLVTPTAIERSMQLAYLAKLNSGCLSRQVGAIITDDKFVVKAVGWNEVPVGQTPCALRDIRDLCSKKNLTRYSIFEQNNSAFMSAMTHINNSTNDASLCGRNHCFCFKDVYNSIEGEKNQVYTRSLHAEENAFLVNSKNGGSGIKGGKLFVTASPCELCSKKSYQLGVKEIYYIDPYPGIAQEHTIKFGSEENTNNPRVHLYYGAIGDAYIKLYTQTIAKKDELECLTGNNIKQLVSEINHPQSQDHPFDAFNIEKLDIEFEFESRTSIECRTTFIFKPKKPNITSINRMISWTGNEYCGTKVIPENYEIKEKIDNDVSYHQYTVDFKQELEIDKSYQFTLVSKVKDTHMVMSPYFSNRVRYITKALSISIIAPNDIISQNSMTFVTFADPYMQQKIQEKKVRAVEKEGKTIYSVLQRNPILNYSYSMMWKF